MVTSRLTCASQMTSITQNTRQAQYPVDDFGYQNSGSQGRKSVGHAERGGARVDLGSPLHEGMGSIMQSDAEVTIPKSSRTNARMTTI